jgi:hypothetical protein
MRFFSNDAKENTDDRDDEHPERVQSEPVAVPQQRAGSPWSDAPAAPADDTSDAELSDQERADGTDEAADGRASFHEPGGFEAGGAAAAGPTGRWDAGDRASTADAGDDRDAVPGGGVVTADQTTESSASTTGADADEVHRDGDHDAHDLGGGRDDTVDAGLADRGRFDDSQVRDESTDTTDETADRTADTADEAHADTATDTTDAARADTATDTTDAAQADTATDTTDEAPADTATDTTDEAWAGTATDTADTAPADTTDDRTDEARADATSDSTDETPADTTTGTMATYGPDGTVTTTDRTDADVTDSDRTDEEAALKDEGDFDDPTAVDPATDKPLDSDASAATHTDTDTDADTGTETATDADAAPAVPVAAGAATAAGTTTSATTTNGASPDLDADGATAAGMPIPVPVGATDTSTAARTSAAETGESDKGDKRPGTVAAPELGSLFAEADAASFHERWRDVQLRFVDSPKEATTEAARLVDEAVEKLTASLKAQKDALTVDSDDTEQLRVEMRSYRDIFNRILGL